MLSNKPSYLRRAGKVNECDHDMWVYEAPYGLCVVARASTTTRHAVIPIRKIRAYLDRLAGEEKDGD